MNEPHRGYFSYLMRLWQAQDNGEWVWRASLECSQSGQRRFFANLDDLLMFVSAKTSELSADLEGHEELPGCQQKGVRK